MSNNFEQISLKPGFMKHNGGLLFKTISEKEYQFKTIIKEKFISTLQHAADMGIELHKAELSLRYGFKYIQDKEIKINK